MDLSSFQILEILSKNLWIRLQKNPNCEHFPLSKLPHAPPKYQHRLNIQMIFTNQVPLFNVGEEQTLPFGRILLYKMLEKIASLGKLCGGTRGLGCPKATCRWQHAVTTGSHGGTRRTHPGGGLGGYAEASALAFCWRNALTRVWILHRFSREGKASKLHNYAIVITRRRPNKTE